MQKSPLDQLRDRSDGQGQRVGDLAVGSRESREYGQLGEHLLERHVLPAQDVAAPGPPLLEHEHLPRGQVVDMRHVQHGVHEGRHATVQEVEDQLAGRGGGAIPGPDRERREDQRCRQPLGDGPQDLVLGHVLGPLVGAIEMSDVRKGPLVGRAGARDVLESRACRRCWCRPTARHRLPRRPRGRSACRRR